MYSTEKTTGEKETRHRAMTLIENVAAVLGLLVLGFPLTPTTIRAMLIGWILIVVAITQVIRGRFQSIGVPAVLMVKIRRT